MLSRQNKPIRNTWLQSLWAPILFCLLVASVCANEPDDGFSKIVAPAIKQHCAKCHGASDEVDGDVNLLSLNSDNLSENIELIGQVIEALDLQEMPPADEPELNPELREKLVAELKRILHDSISKQKSFSHAPIRRMNRFQYNNAVTDLFELKCVVFALPERMLRDHQQYFQPETGKMADVVKVGNRPMGKSQLIERRLAGVTAFPQDLRAEHGFDNQGDHLSLSPLLMESFLKLGQSITQSPDFTIRNVGIWKSFFVAPQKGDMETQIRERLQTFLTRAFRSPVKEDVLDRYVEFANRKIEGGEEFEKVMKSVAAATISSPKFLYLYNQSGESNFAEPLNDFEIASRLSFFLWGSVPDQTLLDLAAQGELSKPEVLEAQVDRMLTDRKLKRFCDSFPTQWLQMDRIISSAPNRKSYPKFYLGNKYRTSMHMMIEPLLLFETVLVENRPVTQLIDSDFTYRSAQLENVYGELKSRDDSKFKKGGGVGVLTFSRVPVADRRSGGVITNAAVMTMTSGPERTQPITRGAWLATVIFNNPPDPPPADVPPLDEKPTAGEEHLTLRERLSAHRERADCNGCHEQIDPLGFALENYDAIGNWRDKYENDREVDMAGTLLRKHKFTDVVEFKDAILSEKDLFARGFAGHLLSFALARELEAADQVALDEIVAATAEDDYKIQTMLKKVILSKPFLSKSNSRVGQNRD